MNRVSEVMRGHERVLLVCGGVLLMLGFLYALTASPTAAARMGYDSTFLFALRQGAFALAAALVCIGVCWLPETAVRRAGVLMLLGAMALLALVLLVGHEAKGAQRWLRVAGLSLQPSEFAKPALVIAMAWMLASGIVQRGFPGAALAMALCAVTAALLVAQPDYGQTALLLIVLAAMLYLSGASWRLFAIGGVLAAVGGFTRGSTIFSIPKRNPISWPARSTPSHRAACSDAGRARGSSRHRCRMHTPTSCSPRRRRSSAGWRRSASSRSTC